MSSTRQLPKRGAPSRLALRPYQVLSIGALASVVALGSTYAVLKGTSSYNLFQSDPLRFPAAVTALRPQTIFADRRNLVNALFVKRLWLWTTAACVLQAAVLRRPWSKVLQRAQGAEQPGANDPLARSVLRYIIATLAWIFFTSWFLGPGLADRTFLLTGGECRLELGNDKSIRVPSDICRARTTVSLSSHPHLFRVDGFNPSDHEEGALSNLRPRLRGGIDMSGHTFLLTLSILLLLEEAAPFVPYLLLRLPTVIRPSKAQVEWLIPRAQWASLDPLHPPTTTGRPASTTSRGGASGSGVQAVLDILARPHVQAYLALAAMLGHIALSAFMLGMTQLYFHTWTENLAGLIIGLLSWYALPKDEPALRRAA